MKPLGSSLNRSWPGVSRWVRKKNLGNAPNPLTVSNIFSKIDNFRIHIESHIYAYIIIYLYIYIYNHIFPNLPFYNVAVGEPLQRFFHPSPRISEKICRKSEVSKLIVEKHSIYITNIYIYNHIGYKISLIFL